MKGLITFAVANATLSCCISLGDWAVAFAPPHPITGRWCCLPWYVPPCRLVFF